MTQLLSLDLWALDLSASDLRMLLALPNLHYLSLGSVGGAPELDADAVTGLILDSANLKHVWLDGVHLDQCQRDVLGARLESLRLTS